MNPKTRVVVGSLAMIAIGFFYLFIATITTTIHNITDVIAKIGYVFGPFAIIVGLGCLIFFIKDPDAYIKRIERNRKARQQ